MRMIASKRRSSFGTNCVQCDNELIAPKGPSIGIIGDKKNMEKKKKKKKNGVYRRSIEDILRKSKIS